MHTLSWTDVRLRELPPEDWPRLQEVVSTWDSSLPLPSEARVLIAENPDGDIVGYLMAFQAIHLEPIWVREDYRRKPGVVRKLWKAGIEMLQSCGVTWAFATVAIQDAVPNQAITERVGFTRMAADLYFLEIPPLSATLPSDAPIPSPAEESS